VTEGTITFLPSQRNAVNRWLGAINVKRMLLVIFNHYSHQNVGFPSMGPMTVVKGAQGELEFVHRKQ
jgi:hypothetical protein